jgi:hypothetical protein
MGRSLLVDVARESAKNALMAVPVVRDWRINRPRAGAEFSPDLLERYAFQGLREVERLVGPVRGKSIVEFGPGDTLSAGIAFLAAGAASYASLDRFVPDYSRAAAKRWYTGVQSGWANAFPDYPWPADLDPSTFPEAYPADRVRHISGAIENAAADTRYDVVTSWQVGEHVNDIQAFANLTARLLVPGGAAIHRIDFGPHDCWLCYDPWLFLRFPSMLWHMMGSNRGYPNRRRHHEFLAAWQSAGLTVKFHDTTRFDGTGRLRGTFVSMPHSSLMIKDTVYVCHAR